MAVTDIVSRPVRGLAQGGVAWAAVEFVDSELYNLTDRGYAAAVVLATAIVSVIQVAVENGIGKGFLRKPEPPAKRVEPIEEARA
jgi:hypothetical protein